MWQYFLTLIHYSGSMFTTAYCCYIQPTWTCWILKMTHRDHSYFPGCSVLQEGWMSDYDTFHLSSLRWRFPMIYSMLKRLSGASTRLFIASARGSQCLQSLCGDFTLQCLHKLEGVFCCTFLLAGSLTNEGHAWLLAMQRRYFPSTCEGHHG